MILFAIDFILPGTVKINAPVIPNANPKSYIQFGAAASITACTTVTTIV
jgi:hypothetical protein